MEPITRTEQFLARAAGNSGEDLTPLTRLEHFLKDIADAQGGGGGSVTSVNGQTGDVVLTASDVGAAAVETFVEVEGTAPTITPESNTIYNCGTLTSLTISNPPATGAYSIVFISGTTETATTIPATILGLESFAAAANTLYEVSVLDNRALVGSWAVSASE